MREYVQIFWHKLGTVNGHEASLPTSAGVLDLHSFCVLSDVSFDAVQRVLLIVFNHDLEDDTDMPGIASISFVFSDVEDYSIRPSTCGEIDAAIYTDIDRNLEDLGFPKQPPSDKEVCCVFEFNSGRVIEVHSSDVQIAVEYT